MIIGVCGLIGSGKGTVGNFLQGVFRFHQESFASPLKDITSTLFSWDRNILEGSNPDTRKLRENIDPWWSEKLGRQVSMRSMLQEIGTQVFRNNLHQDIWVIAIEKKLLDMTKLGKHIVVTDVRFPNEIAMIKRLGGTVIEVRRGELPDWYGRASIVNNRPMENGSFSRKLLFMEDFPHESEWKWVGNENISVVIENNGTIDELHKKLVDLVETIMERNDNEVK